jgi:hypothetical protein
MFMPHRLHMRLAGEVADYSPDDASPASLATWVHEYVHFLQTIMSGYGHISWDSHRQLTGYMINEWRAILDGEGSRARIPLAQLLEFERLMRDAMEFKAAAPWCCANPALDIESFEQLTKRFHVPFVEIRGRLARFGPEDEKLRCRDRDGAAIPSSREAGIWRVLQDCL